MYKIVFLLQFLLKSILAQSTCSLQPTMYCLQASIHSNFMSVCTNQHWYCPQIQRFNLTQSIQTTNCTRINGRIGSPCSVNNDCFSDLCNGGICSRQIIISNCQNSDQCSQSEYCSNNNCVPRSQDGGVCFGDQECVNNVCRPIPTCTNLLSIGHFCTSHNQCQNKYCEKLSNSCQQPSTISCRNNSDCRSQLKQVFTYCQNGQCQLKRDLGGSCSSNLQCRSNLCIGNRCTQPSRNQCQIDSDCLHLTEKCRLGKCTTFGFEGYECKSHFHCQDGFFCDINLNPSICKSQSTSQCEYSSHQCAKGLVCVNKVCTNSSFMNNSPNADCLSDWDCEKFQYCQASSKICSGKQSIGQFCSSSSQCDNTSNPYRTVCSSFNSATGVCQLAGNQCTKNESCKFMQRCDLNFGKCVDSGSIAVSQQSNSNLRCISGTVGKYGQDRGKCIQPGIFNDIGDRQIPYPYNAYYQDPSAPSSHDSQCSIKQFGFNNQFISLPTIGHGINGQYWCQGNIVGQLGFFNYLNDRYKRSDLPDVAIQFLEEYKLAGYPGLLIPVLDYEQLIAMSLYVQRNQLLRDNFELVPCLKHQKSFFSVRDYDFQSNRNKIEQNILASYLAFVNQGRFQDNILYLIYFLVLLVILLAGFIALITQQISRAELIIKQLHIVAQQDDDNDDNSNDTKQPLENSKNHKKKKKHEKLKKMQNKLKKLKMKKESPQYNEQQQKMFQ